MATSSHRYFSSHLLPTLLPAPCFSQRTGVFGHHLIGTKYLLSVRRLPIFLSLLPAHLCHCLPELCACLILAACPSLSCCACLMLDACVPSQCLPVSLPLTSNLPLFDCQSASHCVLLLLVQWVGWCCCFLVDYTGSIYNCGKTGHEKSTYCSV